MGLAVVFTSRLRFLGWMLFSFRTVLTRFELFALFKPVCQGSRLGPSWIHIIVSRWTPVVQWCPSGRRLVAQSLSSGFPHNFERLSAHPRTAFRICINVCWHCPRTFLVSYVTSRLPMKVAFHQNQVPFIRLSALSCGFPHHLAAFRAL